MSIDPIVQADLATRLAGIATRAVRAPAGELAGDVEMLRRAALAAGMVPVAGVAHTLGGVLATSGARPQIDGWLAILADAIASGRSDPQACETFAAICSVRLAG